MEKKVVYLDVKMFHPALNSLYCDAFDVMNKSSQPFNLLVISSFGGYVLGLMPLLSEMESSDKPTICVCQDYSMSCGSVLLLSGDISIVAPHSSVMIHEASSACGGKSSELMAEAGETHKTTQQYVYDIGDKKAKKDSGYTQSLIKENMNADLFLNAKECVEHGYADLIASRNYVINNAYKIYTEWKQAQDNKIGDK